MGIGAQPSAPPPPATGNFLRDTLDVFNVLYEPEAVFNRVRDRARIVAPWVVLSALFIVISILNRPYQLAAWEAFKATLTPEQIARMGNRGGGGGPLGLVFAPLLVLIFLAAGAGMLWVGVSLTGTPARYKTLLSVLAYSCITFMLFSAIVIVVLTVRGKTNITGFEDLRAPLGLDLLVPRAGLYLGTVLNAINPFSAWGVWLTGTGMSITHRVPRGTAILVTAVVFVIGALILATPTLFLGMLTRQ